MVLLVDRHGLNRSDIKTETKNFLLYFLLQFYYEQECQDLRIIGKEGIEGLRDRRDQAIESSMVKKIKGLRA